jgi:hypothetical protein
MKTFVQWCQDNGYKGLMTVNGAVTAMMAMLNDHQASFHRIHRTANSNVQVRATTAMTNAFPANNAAPSTPQEKQAILQAAQNFVTAEVQQGQQDLNAYLTWLDNNRALPANALAGILLPDEYFQDPFDKTIKFERTLARKYLSYVLAAIAQYATQGVPHSGRTADLAKDFNDRINAFLGTELKDGTAELLDYYEIMVARVIHGLIGATTIQEVARFWHKRRTGTAKRMQKFQQQCANVAGAGTGQKLRRYGSYGEATDVATRQGFYLRVGQSFEQYKWFCDMAIQGATTSVSDSEATFWVQLKGGAREAINALKELYNNKDQPPVMHKPDMTGETGCFGVHEDVLAMFNGLMIHEVEIKKKNPPSFSQKFKPPAYG